MIWPFNRIGKTAKPLRTERLELITITPALLAAEQQGPKAFSEALQARIPAEWPPEHWEPHVHTFITHQLTTQPETTGYHRYILLPDPQLDPSAACLSCGPRRTLVGCTGSFPKEDGDVELGYSTLPMFQRRGFATEAVTALVDWLFTHKEVASVSAQTYPTLPESIKIMERVGMSPAGEGDEPDTVRYRRQR